MVLPLTCYYEQTLQGDAASCQAAVKAAELLQVSAASNTPIDELALQEALLEQQAALKAAADVRSSRLPPTYSCKLQRGSVGNVPGRDAGVESRLLNVLVLLPALALMLVLFSVLRRSTSA